jgi:hypothetical protein
MENNYSSLSVLSVFNFVSAIKNCYLAVNIMLTKKYKYEIKEI